MQEFVARENIRRFLAQLDACSDPERRKTLLELLETERQHLAQAKSGKLGQSGRREAS